MIKKLTLSLEKITDKTAEFIIKYFGWKTFCRIRFMLLFAVLATIIETIFVVFKVLFGVIV